MANATTMAAGQQNRTDRMVSVTLLGVMALELVRLVTGSHAVEVAVGGCVLLSALLSARRFGMREYYLLTICLALAGLVWTRAADPAAVLAEGMGQAAFLMAFLLLVGLIQQAGTTSADVRECGLWMTGQPPGRRYATLFLGTHFMAHVFNLGMIALISPLIMRGTADMDDPRNPIRRRRQIGAVLNGFAWSIIWSPTAISPLALMVLLPDADRVVWIGAGIVIAALMFLVGRAEDRLRWRPAASAPMAEAPPFPRAAFRGFGGLCLALLALTLAGMEAFGQSIVFGLMLASPIIMAGWQLNQSGGDARATGRRVAGIFRTYLPASGPLAVTLACSGFIGRVAAHLTPAAEIAEALNIMDMPGWAFMLGLSLLVAAVSWLAVSPVMLAVFLGAVLAELPAMPVSATWAALAVSCGWSLAMMASPFATTVLLNQQMTGVPGLTFVRWNARYFAFAVATLGLCFAALTALD